MGADASVTATVLIILPKYYNPDASGRRKKIERWKIDLTCREIVDKMIVLWGEGGCTLDMHPRKGYWGKKRGVPFKDDVVTIEIDNIPDSPGLDGLVKAYLGRVLCDRHCQMAMSAMIIREVQFCTVEAVKGGEVEASGPGTCTKVQGNQISRLNEMI